MIELLGAWVRSLAAAGLLTAVALALTPKGLGKGAVKLVCAAMLCAVTLEPLRTLDLETLAEAVSAQKLAARGVGDQTTADTALLYRLIIREETEAYILDKAKLLGLEGLRVELTLKEGTRYPYPWSVKLNGHADTQQRAALSACLEGDLGLPPSRQQWSGDDAE